MKFFCPEGKSETYFSFFFVCINFLFCNLSMEASGFEPWTYGFGFKPIIYLIYTNETRPNQFSHQYTTQKRLVKGGL